MTRAEKISLLKGIMNGTRQLSELLPLTWIHFIQVKEGSDQFVRMTDGRVFSLEQIEEMQKATNKNQPFIIGLTSDTPIAYCEEDVIM